VSTPTAPNEFLNSPAVSDDTRKISLSDATSVYNVSKSGAEMDGLVHEGSKAWAELRGRGYRVYYRWLENRITRIVPREPYDQPVHLAEAMNTNTNGKGTGELTLNGRSG